MLLTIYDSKGNKRADIAAEDSSTQQKEVQGDNILTLSFKHYMHIPLDVNDYTDYEGERYWLTEKYTPAQKSEGEWEYDLKLYGIESLIRRFLVLETTDGDTNPLFTLTATPREHVAMIVKCINDGMGHTGDWKVGQVDGTELIVIDYEGKYCNEALKEIAEKTGGGAEWWMEGQTVNVCRCEHGEEITLGYGKGLTSLERDTGNTDKFYTRLFPVGSTRNIDPEKYGSPRLMLPGKKRYIEVGVDEYGIYDHYEEKAFGGIYPRRTGTVSSVRKEDVKDDDGNPFTIYYFSDSSLDFDPNSYELPGETKRVSFQGGDLAGLGQGDDHYFEVNYDSKTREFELITTWPYDDDTQLPGGNLVPRKGDPYILWNIRMPDEYYPMAEEEFQKAVDEYNKEHWRDISVYKAPTDPVWMEENRASLYVGRRVKLESRTFFPETGYRSSRITKITRKVNLPGQMDIEISDALQSGALERVNDSIGELKNYTKSKTEGVALPDIIKSWDSTLPTDNNLFSARRSQKEFLNKHKPDTATALQGFLQGVTFGEYVPGRKGGSVDGGGNAEYLTAVIRELLRSVDFVDGLTGEGWQVWIDRLTGLSHLTIDKLTIRQTLVALELLVEKARSIGGQFIVSAANGKVKDVIRQGENYRILFEQECGFVAHDLVRCATFSGKKQKAYWVEVSAGDATGMTVPASEFCGVVPEPGDECVLMGNTANVLRRNLISISATEDGQPRIDILDGVQAKNFNGCLRCRLGNLDGIKDSRFPANNQPHGNGLYGDNVYLRGTFVLMTGEDIATKFLVTEGKIEAAVDGVRQGMLSNPSFSAGMSKWETQNEARFFLVGGKWVWANGGPLSEKGGWAGVVQDEGRTVAHIRNTFIRQRSTDMRNLPAFPTGPDGLKKAVPVYVKFSYRCAKPGTLTVGFENVDAAGFEAFDALHAVEALPATEGYADYACSGLWNGTGNFYISFTGETNIHLPELVADKADSLEHRYQTLFEQSERLVQISAASYDKEGNPLGQSQLFIQPDKAGLVTVDKDGNLAQIGTYEDGKIVLSGKQIQLTGSITAQGNINISEDGSIEMKNAIVSGFVKHQPLVLTADNMSQYCVYGTEEAQTPLIDIRKCGEWVVLDSSLQPARFGFYDMGAREIRGAEVMLYNHTGREVTLIGLTDENASGIPQQALGAGFVLKADLKVSFPLSSSQPYEAYRWQLAGIGLTGGEGPVASNI